MNVDKDEAIYPISVATKILGVTPETLRAYEHEGLIKPHKTQGGKRLYSQNDIDWINYIRHLIHDEKLTISCVRKLLEVFYCYEIAGSPKELKEKAFAIQQKKQFDLIKKVSKSLFE